MLGATRGHTSGSTPCRSSSRRTLSGSATPRRQRRSSSSSASGSAGRGSRSSRTWFPEYLPALEGVFGDDPESDYAQVIAPKTIPEAVEKGLRIVRQLGTPDEALIGTSYVERHDGTIRQQIRRFTRKTLAFSKKLRNLRVAVTL